MCWIEDVEVINVRSIQGKQKEEIGMSRLELSPDCILPNKASAIVDELLKGSYIIVADLKPEMLLQNVLHWNKRKRAFEVFTLLGDKNREQYNICFEHAMYINNNVKETLLMIIEGSIPECDLFMIDKHNSLNKEVIFGKSGNKYKNVQ